MELMLLLVIGVLGVACGFLIWRQARTVSREAHQHTQDALRDLQVEFGKLQEREHLLSEEYAKVESNFHREQVWRQQLALDLEAEKIRLEAQHDKLRQQQETIQQMKTEFRQEFQLLADRILEEKSQKFSALNKDSLQAILDPLKERIKAFEDRVEKTYKEEAAERNTLKGTVEQLMQQSGQIREEANNLARALKGDNKKQGNWGEVILERVLERSGLIKDQEFKLQVAMLDEHGKRAQPDAIIYLPDEKHLVIDSKLSLLAYERAVNADADEDRAVFVRQHIQSIENHVRDLARKDYQTLYGLHSPDFVLMFIPIESSLSLAVQHKPELFSDAWDRRVVIVSPSTLLATLRTIASIWKQERQNRNVLEIAREAGLLYDKFVGFLTDMEQLETLLQRASGKHADAMKKLSEGSGNVVRKIEQLKVLGAKTNKSIGDRYLDT